MQIYNELFKLYGPQGWWPLLDVKGTNPTKTGSVNCYHPGDFSYPKNNNQIFEICLGAILTQNTAWINVEKALVNLKRANALYIKGMKKLSLGKLKELIKPAGYFNQKSDYIKEFAKFFLVNSDPTRNELLKVRGIGPETADSILLYAYKKPEFVVDAYTKRIFTHLKIIEEGAPYHNIKEAFESSLPKDVQIYQEYHALIVEHAKKYYQKKPYSDTLLCSFK